MVQNSDNSQNNDETDCKFNMVNTYIPCKLENRYISVISEIIRKFGISQHFLFWVSRIDFPANNFSIFNVEELAVVGRLSTVLSIQDGGGGGRNKTNRCKSNVCMYIAGLFIFG